MAVLLQLILDPGAILMLASSSRAKAAWDSKVGAASQGMRLLVGGCGACGYGYQA
jgi:hypothetical protein